MAALKEKPGRSYFMLSGAVCFSLGCLYLLDIRIDGPALAFGVNAYQWIHIGLFGTAVCMGAAVSSSQRAVRAWAVMILSEMAGIIMWVGYILQTEPNNNLWPLGFLIFSFSGIIVIGTGVLIGYLAGRSVRKKRGAGADSVSD